MKKPSHQNSKTKRGKKGDSKVLSKKIPLNTSFTFKNGNGPRIIHRNDGVSVSHKEWVTEVSGMGSGAFSLVTYFTSYQLLSPQNNFLFPWLSTMAPLYEYYRFKRLKVIYRPTVPATTNGQIFMAFDYDVNDSTPTTKQRMMQYKGAVDGSIWNGLELAFSPTDAEMELGWRKTSDSYTYVPNTDTALYAAASVYVGTRGLDTGGGRGDLLIDYDVEFSVPQYSTEALTSVFERYTTWFSTYTNLFSSLSTSLGALVANFGTGTYANRIGLQPGTYRIEFQANAAAGNWLSAPVTPTITSTGEDGGGSVSWSSPESLVNLAGSVASFFITVKVLAMFSEIVIFLPFSWAGLTSSSVLIKKYASTGAGFFEPRSAPDEEERKWLKRVEFSLRAPINRSAPQVEAIPVYIVSKPDPPPVLTSSNATLFQGETYVGVPTDEGKLDDPERRDVKLQKKVDACKLLGICHHCMNRDGSCSYCEEWFMPNKPSPPSSTKIDPKKE